MGADLGHRPGHAEDTPSVQRGDEVAAGLVVAVAVQRLPCRVPDQVRVDGGLRPGFGILPRNISATVWFAGLYDAEASGSGFT